MSQCSLCTSFLASLRPRFFQSPNLHASQLRLQLRNASAAEKLRITDQQEVETAVSAAIKRHHEEEIQLIKENLSEIVSTLRSDIHHQLMRVYLRRQRRISKCPL